MAVSHAQTPPTCHGVPPPVPRGEPDHHSRASSRLDARRSDLARPRSSLGWPRRRVAPPPSLRGLTRARRATRARRTRMRTSPSCRLAFLGSQACGTQYWAIASRDCLRAVPRRRAGGASSADGAAPPTAQSSREQAATACTHPTDRQAALQHGARGAHEGAPQPAAGALYTYSRMDHRAHLVEHWKAENTGRPKTLEGRSSARYSGPGCACGTAYVFVFCRPVESG